MLEKNTQPDKKTDINESSISSERRAAIWLIIGGLMLLSSLYGAPFLLTIGAGIYLGLELTRFRG
jgi:hypothetical protein